MRSVRAALRLRARSGTSPRFRPIPRRDASADVEAHRVKKLLLNVLIGLLLAAAGGASVWFWTRGAQAAAPQDEEPAPAAINPADSGMVSLEPFLVNLADPEAPRFLRATVSLVVGPKARAEELAGDQLTMARVRSTVLELLTTQRASALVTPEGKAELKRAITERVTAVIGRAQVHDVLFADFVVQF